MNGVHKVVHQTSRCISVVNATLPIATRFQIPLTLGWAVTLHKAQDLILEAASVQVSDAFAPGMRYVAMSRVRCAKGFES